MKVAAIIAEYNPFHTGHEFHIAETKKTADAVIVLMSGSFVQRGEGAIFSKFARAKAAVLSGADLVLELPFIYSTASSRDFAKGAVNLLNSLSVVDILSFGSECGDLDLLVKRASLEETDSFKTVLKKNLSSGLSYPKAEEEALKELSLPYISGPNDSLGTEYLKSLLSLNSTITPFLVKRTVEHDSSIEKSGFLSASALREKIEKNEDVSSYLPCLFDEKPLAEDLVYPLISYAVMNLDKENYPIRSKSDSDLISTIKNTPLKGDFESYLYNIKSKRYTMSRVKRTLLHILLNSGEKIPDFAPYARVLALNSVGGILLKRIKKESSVKVITKLKEADLRDNYSLSLDVRATDLRSIALSESTGQDFLVSPFVSE